jgi:hypothetical protein
MRVLMLDSEAVDKVKKVLAFARANVYYPENARVPGDNPKYSCHLNSFRCVFTYTKDPESGKLFRHLSISVPSKDYPSPEAVSVIAGLFEFRGSEEGVEDQVRNGKWILHVEHEEPHCVVLAEELA